MFFTDNCRRFVPLVAFRVACLYSLYKVHEEKKQESVYKIAFNSSNYEYYNNAFISNNMIFASVFVVRWPGCYLT